MIDGCLDRFFYGAPRFGALLSAEKISPRFRGHTRTPPSCCHAEGDRLKSQQATQSRRVRSERTCCYRSGDRNGPRLVLKKEGCSTICHTWPPRSRRSAPNRDDSASPTLARRRPCAQLASQPVSAPFARSGACCQPPRRTLFSPLNVPNRRHHLSTTCCPPRPAVRTPGPPTVTLSKDVPRANPAGCSRVLSG